jgi:DNA polymerase-3 subunit beta
MKLTLEKPAFAAALAKITSIVERRNTIPIIGNVMLTASANNLTALGTDLDIEVTDSVPASVERQGSTTVSAEMLANIVKKAPNGALISLDFDGNQLSISFGRSNFKLATLDPTDFPVMASSEYEAEFQIESDQLARLFGKTAFAMSTEETKYYLNGVYMHHTPEGLTAVATDGHKLAKVALDHPQDFPGVIVPRKTVNEVRKALSENPVTIAVSATKIRFKSGNTVIVSKVIDGTFPDYTRVIPQWQPHSFSVDSGDMKEASDRVAMVAEDKTRAVAITIGDGVISLKSQAPQSEANDEVDADVNGDPMRIGFNSRYLADALAQCDGGRVTISYSDSGAPCVIRPDSDGGFIAVVMPMRV